MKIRTIVLSLLLLTGCASVQRDCKSCGASSFGTDWLVVRYSAAGVPVDCWQLRNAVVTSESTSDGIWWQDPERGHLVHLGGWYDHVQVSRGDFAEAANSLGIDIRRCPGGRYTTDDRSSANESDASPR